MERESVCVLGGGSTKYGKLDDSISDITLQASVGAIESAGIEPKEIEAGYISNVFGVADKQVHLGPVVMSNLGISECPSLSIESACGSGSVSFREAFANVAAGFYDAVLVTGTEKVTHTGTDWTTTYFSYCSDFFYEGQAGASFPGLFASMARAYLHEFNATEEDLASVAVKNHENGVLNPKAHLRKKISIDDVMDSAVVASPLKLYDCCPFSDGASSVILCNEKFAKEQGSGIEFDSIIGIWKFISIWKKDIDEEDPIFSSLLRVFSAKIEFKKELLTKNSTELSVIASIQFGLFSIGFSGTGYLKGKQPLLPFWLNLIELKAGSNILLRRSLKEKEDKEKSFFAMIALEENEELLSARGQGGEVVIWLKD